MNKILKEFSLFIFSLVEISLILRFLLKLFGASTNASFVSFIYENTQFLLSPFMFAFPQPSINGNYVIEFTTLFAVFVYAFANYIIQELLKFIKTSADSSSKSKSNK